MKVTAGFTRKIGQENFGSVGADFHIEQEVSDDADPQEIAKALFNDCEQVVAERLAQFNGSAPAAPAGHADAAWRDQAMQIAEQMMRYVPGKSAPELFAIMERKAVKAGLPELNLQFAQACLEKCKAAAPPPEPEPQTNAEAMFTGPVTIENVEKKEGTSDSGRSWTKYRINTSDGKWFGTLDPKKHKIIDSARGAGRAVTIRYTKGKYGFDIKDIAFDGPGVATQLVDEDIPF